MKKNKNIIIIVLLSMLLPITLLIISIVVYEDETPWDGWVYSNNKNLYYVDDYATKEMCIEAMVERQKKLNKSSYICGKKCEDLKEGHDASKLKCLEVIQEEVPN